MLLLPPSSGADLGALPAWSASPHHCQCSSEEAARHPDALPVIIDVGEALLIPAGWYHAVASPAGTVAVNCWWPPALMCRSQKALAMKVFHKNQGPQVAFFARPLIRRQRAAVNKAAGELDSRICGRPHVPDAVAPGLKNRAAGACAALSRLDARGRRRVQTPARGWLAPDGRGAVLGSAAWSRDRLCAAVKKVPAKRFCGGDALARRVSWRDVTERSLLAL